MNRNFAGASLLCALLMLALAAPLAAKDTKQIMIEARIVQVVSGDQMSILQGHDLLDFRLAGVVCPAPGEPMGNEARDYTRERVSGEEVHIRLIPLVDGPLVTGDIVLENGSLVGELLEHGLGTWNHLEVPDPALGQLETQARVERKGQWGVPALADIPVLRGLFARNDPARVEELADLILGLPPGDRARLNSRLGGSPGGYYAPGTTTIISGDRYPGQVQNGARIIERSSGRSSDLGIGFGDDGVVIRGGAAEHTRQSDTQIEVFGPANGTMIIENGVVPHGSGRRGSSHGDSSYGDSSGGGGAVYASGGKFHRASCFGGGNPGPGMSRSAALEAGLSACPTCKP